MLKLPKELKTVTPLSKYLAMVLFIILPFWGFYLGIQYQKLNYTANNSVINPQYSSPKPTPQPVVLPISASEEFIEIYNKVSQNSKYFIRQPQILEDDVWWITPDGWSILVTTNESFVAKVLPTGSSPNKIEFTKLNSIVKQAMQTNGFSFNSLNSSSSESDGKYYDYVQAYEKGEIKCLATSSPDVGHGSDETKFYSSFTFSCFKDADLQSAYAKQSPFLKGLNAKEAVVSNIRINGNRATMSINWRRTGASVWMYRVGNEWKKVIIAQAIPMCAELEKNNVPKEFWITCFDSNNKEVPGSFNFDN